MGWRRFNDYVLVLEFYTTWDQWHLFVLVHIQENLGSCATNVLQVSRCYPSLGNTDKNKDYQTRYHVCQNVL